MKNLTNNSLRTFASALKIMKEFVAGNTDGTFIGVDTVSGGPYTGELQSIGSVFMLNGTPRVAVDAIAYGDHVGTKDKFYPGTNRFIVLEINPDDLTFTGKRTNVDFNVIDKAQKLGNVWEYVMKVEAEKELAAKRLAEKAAKRAREAAAAKKRIIIGNF